MHVDVHDSAASRDGDDDGIGEHRHTRRRAVTHAGFARGERRIGIQMEVRAQDLRQIVVDDDGAIHLGKLEQTVRRERDIEREAIVASRENVLGVSDANQGAKVSGDDHVEGGADRLARGGQANRLLHALLYLVLIQCSNSRRSRSIITCIFARNYRTPPSRNTMLTEKPSER